MDNLTSPRELKRIIEKYGFSFTKSLGQNFLIDQNILNKIIDGIRIKEDDCVLEVGPGVGTLTRELARRAKYVAAIEIDKRLLPILDETLKGFNNIHIVNDDILKADLESIVQDYFNGHSFKVVGNLPYYITTPVIMRFLEEGLPAESLIFMVQKEVADRLAAKPGTKDYGALTVAVKYYADIRVVAKAPASVFMPSPKVDSMAVALDRRDDYSLKTVDPNIFFTVVKAAFSKRRKTLINALSTYSELNMEKNLMLDVLKECGIDPSLRGETLDIPDFVEIANNIAKKVKPLI